MSAAPEITRTGLEVDGRASVEVAAERVVGPRIGVTVTRARRTEVRSRPVGVAPGEQRRLPVQNVVGTQTEVEVIADCKRRREIEVALRRNMKARVEVEIP